MSDFVNRPKCIAPFRNISVVEARAKRPANFELKISEGSDTAVIYILDEIGGWGVYASEIIPVLRSVSAKKLHIHINSPGGDVFEGVAIANTIAGLDDIETVCIVDGMAASISSIIAISADKCIMRKSTMFMIHRPWTIAWGEADDLRKSADVLDKIEGQLIRSYADRTDKKSQKEIAAAVAAETWLTETEAVEWGFADEVEEKVAAKAVVTADFVAAAKFKNVPDEIKEGSEMTDVSKETETNANVEEVADAGKNSNNDATKASAETNTRTYSAQELKDIKSICAKAKMPEQADKMIEASVAVEDVRAKLFDLMVEAETETEIQTANDTATAPAAPAANSAAQEFEATRARQFARLNNRKN